MDNQGDTCFLSKGALICGFAFESALAYSLRFIQNRIKRKQFGPHIPNILGIIEIGGKGCGKIHKINIHTSIEIINMDVKDKYKSILH